MAVDPEVEAVRGVPEVAGGDHTTAPDPLGGAPPADEADAPPGAVPVITTFAADDD